MVKRGGFNFFDFRKQVKVGLLGEKGYYDKSYFNQVFGKLRGRK